MQSQQDAIRAVRAASNAAIAARDVDRVVACMLEDVTVSVARGPVLNGRDVSRSAFADQFADRAFVKSPLNRCASVASISTCGDSGSRAVAGDEKLVHAENVRRSKTSRTHR